MDIGYLILMVTFFAVIGFFMLQYEPLREGILILLYLLSGSLALYSVETAETDQPVHLTIFIALLVCLIPTMVDSLLSLNTAWRTPKRKNLWLRWHG